MARISTEWVWKPDEAIWVFFVNSKPFGFVVEIGQMWHAFTSKGERLTRKRGCAFHFNGQAFVERSFRESQNLPVNQPLKKGWPVRNPYSKFPLPV